MPNIVELRDFIKRFENYKMLGKELITLKTTVVDDLIKYIRESDIKVEILYSQTRNLIIALRNNGISENEIRKILSLEGEENGEI